MNIQLPNLPRPQAPFDFLGSRLGAIVPGAAESRGGYSVQFDHAAKHAEVRFTGRIDRKSVLDLQLFLETLSEQVETVRLDVSRARGADIRSLAALAMLSGALERKGMAASVTGVLPSLRGEALKARVQHLVCMV